MIIFHKIIKDRKKKEVATKIEKSLEFYMKILKYFKMILGINDLIQHGLKFIKV